MSGAALFGHYSAYRDPSPENQAFWAEREADKFIGAFRGTYLDCRQVGPRATSRWATEIPLFDQPLCGGSASMPRI